MEDELDRLIGLGYTVRRIRVEMTKLGYDLSSTSDEDLICQILENR